MKKLRQRIKLRDELYQCGVLNRQLSEILISEFDSMEEAADYLGCSVSSLYRFKQQNKWPVAQARLLLIRHRGYLPSSTPWYGFKIRGDKLLTPSGREFSAIELNIPKNIKSNDSYALLMRSKKRFKRS
ncbi:DUF3653 domain-containing protein [Vibrio gazogenes]|uniref:S-adenosylhomocysteine hydrolase n=1 Tax=Vibrio gazogenes TaxID=687 RepID=A0A1Z2SB67_VIBGA|nr:DUF3653 domain-containing protein [Vibrio gazogenes]ASA54413.1 hypothetical protein BSQ33_00840 [Vibrio gazogenes]ASA58361.1 hypothetical protein BSQ33_21515 [Vibrio gazogenes]